MQYEMEEYENNAISDMTKCYEIRRSCDDLTIAEASKLGICKFFISINLIKVYSSTLETTML